MEHVFLAVFYRAKIRPIVNVQKIRYLIGLGFVPARMAIFSVWIIKNQKNEAFDI